MSLSNKFMDWLEEGPDWWVGAKVVSLIVGGTGIVLGLVATPLHVQEQQQISENKARSNATTARIDGGRSVVFRSVDECAAKGYGVQTCRDSRLAASALVDSKGTRPLYATYAECAESHIACRQTGSGAASAFAPPVVAWQAAANDLNAAVPLFAGPDARTAWRQDGALVPLPAPAEEKSEAGLSLTF